MCVLYHHQDAAQLHGADVLACCAEVCTGGAEERLSGGTFDTPTSSAGYPGAAVAPFELNRPIVGADAAAARCPS